MMKKLLIGGTAAIVLAGAGYAVYRSERVSYTFATVKRAGIVQEVLADGNVQSPTTINLTFQNPGKLTVLNVGVGQTVKAGAVLAKEDSSVLRAQLAQAEAALSAETAKLQQMQTGASTETVAVAEAAVASAEQALANAYGMAPSTLADAYAKANDAVRNELAAFFVTPEGSNPQLTFAINNSQVLNDAESARLAASAELNAWQASLASTTKNSSGAALDAALASAANRLAAIQNLMNLSLTALTDETGMDAAAVMAYKTLATSGLNEVNAAIAEVNGAEQSIASGKTAVAQAQAGLNLTTASSTPHDIHGQTAAVQQAQASVNAIQAEIDQSTLKAPSDAIVTDTQGSVGENVTPATAIVSLIPSGALEIKLNVSEDNIVGVKVGQPARITLDAFPKSEARTGKVVSVDPAQTFVGGAVYYKTTVLFDKLDPDVKPGMSATVYIQTGSASSTLVVPASALRMNGATSFVETYQNGKLSDQNVATGLESQDGMVEITSGLSEGDQIVIGGT